MFVQRFRHTCVSAFSAFSAFVLVVVDSTWRIRKVGLRRRLVNAGKLNPVFEARINAVCFLNIINSLALKFFFYSLHLFHSYSTMFHSFVYAIGYIQCP